VFCPIGHGRGGYDVSAVGASTYDAALGCRPASLFNYCAAAGYLLASPLADLASEASKDFTCPAIASRAPVHVTSCYVGLCRLKRLSPCRLIREATRLLAPFAMELCEVVAGGDLFRLRHPLSSMLKSAACTGLAG